MGLRSRVVVWYLILFTGLLAVGIVTLDRLLVSRLSTDVTQTLAQEIEELRLLSGGTDPRTGEPFGDDPRRVFEVFIGRNVPAPGEAFFTLVDGQPYASSANLPEDLFERADLVQAWSERPSDGLYGEAETQAGPVRWLAVPVQSGEGPAGTFVVAQFFGPDREEISNAVRLLAIVSLGILALATVLAWLAAGRAIAPIRRLDRAARRASATDLTERLPVTGNDEVARLTGTFNELLARLEAAFTTQRTFLDDVGHDLRTPITILRGNLELLPEDPHERSEVLEMCLDELSRMERYVSDLTLLARAEQPDFLKRAPVDVARLTGRMVERGRGLSSERQWELAGSIDVVALLDDDRITQAWLNLVSNAVQHTGTGDVIRVGSSVAASGSDRRLLLWVEDAGPGVAAEDRGRIFDRRERLGMTRERRPEGSGLGLAIAMAVAEAHGGTARAEDPLIDPSVGSRFVLDLPLRQTVAWPTADDAPAMDDAAPTGTPVHRGSAEGTTATTSTSEGVAR
jgi:signal transduction histidine kinase